MDTWEKDAKKIFDGVLADAKKEETKQKTSYDDAKKTYNAKDVALKKEKEALELELFGTE